MTKMNLFLLSTKWEGSLSLNLQQLDYVHSRSTARVFRAKYEDSFMLMYFFLEGFSQFSIWHPQEHGRAESNMDHPVSVENAAACGQ